jgi:acyl-coenzyme A thioesterase PaaI-like protein
MISSDADRDGNPIGLHLRFAKSKGGVRASFVPAAEHQGFHDLVRGGMISTLLDEAMAWATSAAGIWAVTGEMRFRFRHTLRVGEPVVVIACVTDERARVVTAEAELCREEDGALVATATTTLMRVGAEQEAAWRERYLAGAD